MMAVTNSVTTGVHEVEDEVDGADVTQRLQIVPQMISTLRLDLIFWPYLLVQSQVDRLKSENEKLEKRFKSENEKLEKLFKSENEKLEKRFNVSLISPRSIQMK